MELDRIIATARCIHTGRVWRVWRCKDGSTFVQKIQGPIVEKKEGINMRHG
jgi:hypothetical protein